MLPLPYIVAKILEFAESFEGVSADFPHTLLCTDKRDAYGIRSRRHTVAESQAQVDRGIGKGFLLLHYRTED